MESRYTIPLWRGSGLALEPLSQGRQVRRHLLAGLALDHEGDEQLADARGP